MTQLESRGWISFNMYRESTEGFGESYTVSLTGGKMVKEILGKASRGAGDVEES
jgi:hypothetical protein